MFFLLFFPFGAHSLKTLTIFATPKAGKAEATKHKTISESMSETKKEKKKGGGGKKTNTATTRRRN